MFIRILKKKNQISVIENLEHLISLEYLSLKNNRIRKVENLRTLKKLNYLDLSENLIDDCNPKEFPENIELLLIKGNPIS